MAKQSKVRNRKAARSEARKTGKRGKNWETYEEVAAYMLKQAGKRFGLSDVEGKQPVRGKRSGTNWTIDAKGIREPDGALVIIECRRHEAHLSQEALGGVAWRIIDTGAAGGITVSPHPLQRGAAKVAKAAKIEHVQLTPDSTRERWVAQLQDIMMVGLTETVRVSVAESLTITVRNAAGDIIEERSL